MADFAALMGRPEHDINVAEAALEFARELRPGIDVPLYLQKIDALGLQAAARLSPQDPPDLACMALSRFLFDDMGYRGNAQEYADPRNSYLNEVIDRRLGIPITLCILYVEVGRRAGLSLCGVGFPGHFLARHVGSGAVIDCFNGGRILSRDECSELLRKSYGEQAAMDDRFLMPAKPRETIVRMLNNLKFAYVRSRQLEDSLRVMRLIDVAWPGLAENFRDRGLVEMALDQPAPALKDLEAYARLAPNAPDAPEILKRVQQLKKTLATMN